MRKWLPFGLALLGACGGTSFTAVSDDASVDGGSGSDASSDGAGGEGGAQDGGGIGDAVGPPSEAGTLEGNSCKDILDKRPNAQSGLHFIDPDGSGPIPLMRVYCDMTTGGGGWTMIARSVPGGTGNFGWGVSVGGPGGDSAPYSMGQPAGSLDFQEILVGSHASGSNAWQTAYKFSANPSAIQSHTTSAMTISLQVVQIPGGQNCADTPLALARAGYTNRTDLYFFGPSDTNTNTGLTPHGWSFTPGATFDAGSSCSVDGLLANQQGMIMVR